MPDHSRPIHRAALWLLAASALVASVACGAVPPGPHELAFTIDGDTPRTLAMSGETTVRLSVTNSGTRAWNSARIKFSYHWLWLVPRELPRRSRWNFPYHEGIRTDLPAAIAPRQSVQLDARLLAPSAPGLYWLQWDMVDEGAEWFAQVSPRQSRHLVVVLPTIPALFAPLPLAIALAALFATSVADARRRSAAAAVFIATADLTWCAATLFSKQLLLVPEALLEPTSAAYWLMLITAVLPPMIAAAIVPRPFRAWLLFAGGAVGTFVVFSDIIYYRFFGDVVSAPAALAAHQTGHVLGSIRSLLTSGLAWLVVDLPFAAWMMSRLPRSEPDPLVRRSERGALAATAAALAVAGVVISAPRALAASDLAQTFRNRALVEQLGPFGYHAYDLWNYGRATLMRPGVSGEQIAEARRWFADRAPLRRGAGTAFGAARSRNIIVVQVESLQDFAVDYVIAGQPVMPHLRAWTSEALRFTGVTDQTNEGRTSDAEFVALTSLLPLDHGAVAFRYPANHYVGLPRVLADHGYSTLSAVAFEPGFWNRRVLHPAYGFQHSLFESDFQMTEQIGWGLNDRDFLQQTVAHLERLPRPFCAWLITLSLHHPFDDFPERHKQLKLGELEHTSFGNYLHTMHFFDTALDEFRSALARDGLLETSVLVVFGDHDAGFPRTPAMARTIGIGADAISWAANDRVPLFIRVPGGDPPLNGDVALAAGQSDFAPTILALVGIDPAPLPYVGRNLLGAPDNPPIVRPYGDWVGRDYMFMSSDGPHGAMCYDRVARTSASPEQCADADAQAREARAISRLVVVDDLQERLR